MRLNVALDLPKSIHGCNEPLDNSVVTRSPAVPGTTVQFENTGSSCVLPDYVNASALIFFTALQRPVEPGLPAVEIRSSIGEPWHIHEGVWTSE